MSSTLVLEPEVESKHKRLIGRLVGEQPGPTLVCLGSMHGNEPAGFLALRRVFAALERQPRPLRGEFVGLLGNRAAFEQRRRYLDADLNRHWLPERIEAARQGLLAGSSVAEDRELDELRVEVETAIRRARGTVYVMDFHTTSGDGPPFVTMSDTLGNRAFAMQLPAPIIVGLEEEIAGTLTDFVAGMGHIAIGFEGGQHDSPLSVDHVEASIWISLVSSGLMDAEKVPEAAHARRRLEAVSDQLPRVFEVRYRHAIEAGDAFRMEPGFISFQAISAGQLLARDRHGEVRAREKGRILMPLYQQQGNDGYFEIHEFSPFWLRVSAAMRRLRLQSIVHWLPGVKRHPDLPDALLIDRRVARYFVLEIFHLLGYRRHGGNRKFLVVSRR